MMFKVEEHGGIDPGTFERAFYLKHFAAYKFAGELVKDKRVLEIGFGDGYGSAYLARNAAEVVAVDLFEKNVSAARNRYKNSNLSFQTMNAEDLRFKDNSFDVIVGFQLIEHIPCGSHGVFLKSLKRVMTRNGRCVLTTPNLLVLKKKGTKYQKNPHHDLEFAPEDLETLLSTEFSVVDLYGVDYSMKQKIFLRLKKSGIFNCLPEKMNPVKKYFKNMSENDFVTKRGMFKKAPDILAVCS